VIALSYGGLPPIFKDSLELRDSFFQRFSYFSPEGRGWFVCVPVTLFGSLYGSVPPDRMFLFFLQGPFLTGVRLPLFFEVQPPYRHAIFFFLKMAGNLPLFPFFPRLQFFSP